MKQGHNAAKSSGSESPRDETMAESAPIKCLRFLFKVNAVIYTY